MLCAGLLHVRDSKVFILNLKGNAAQLWTEDLRASHVIVLQERLSPADTSLIPQDNFWKDMSLHWAETF